MRLREGNTIYNDSNNPVDQDRGYPAALLATAGLDDKILLSFPETGDVFKEYDLDTQIDSQVLNLLLSQHPFLIF